MSEQTLWRGTSSQVKNFWPFVSCLLLLPIPWAIYRWLLVKTTTYELTTERLITERGILNKTKDTLELYRVRDLQVTQPFWIRLFGLENIHLLTTDTSCPRITIDCVPAELALPNKFRAQVEATRLAKRVRNVEIDDDSHGAGGAH
jgi:uncharacterized membrane protein YdbT with pleckstrin-like domain